MLFKVISHTSISGSFVLWLSCGVILSVYCFSDIITHHTFCLCKLHKFTGTQKMTSPKDQILYPDLFCMVTDMLILLACVFLFQTDRLLPLWEQSSCSVLSCKLPSHDSERATTAFRFQPLSCCLWDWQVCAAHWKPSGQMLWSWARASIRPKKYARHYRIPSIICPSLAWPLPIIMTLSTI